MKSKFRTMVLATAGLVGSIAVAQAQPAPPPPPAPPPGEQQPPPPPAVQPTQPPPADFGVAPAALPPAPIQQPGAPPGATFGNAPPGADTTTPPAPAPPKKKNPFRLTRFNWTNTASTQIFGIGRDYIGHEGEQYLMDFSLPIRYTFYDKPKDQIFVGTNISWGVELTNSDSTVTKREVQFRDLNVNLGYFRTLAKSESGFTTLFNPVVSALLPTSPQSQNSGRYLATTVTTNLMQIVPLLKSDWLSDVFLFGGGRWQHLFAKSYQAVNGGAPAKRLRMVGALGTAESDVLGLGSLSQNTVSIYLGAFFTVYKDLSFSYYMEYGMPFRHKFEGTSTGCDVSVANDPCVTASRDANAPTMFPLTTFDVSFNYLIANTVRLDLGYQNNTGAIGENGQRRQVFYSPDAQFYANASFYIDSLIWKVINPEAGGKGGRISKAAQRAGAF